MLILARDNGEVAEEVKGSPSLSANSIDSVKKPRPYLVDFPTTIDYFFMNSVKRTKIRMKKTLNFVKTRLSSEVD